MRLPAGIRRARADAPHFCRPTDPAERLAVLGVLSPDEHFQLRTQIRTSWLSSDPQILAYFVMRGLGTLVATLNESAAYGDIVFVDAPSAMPRKSGPLLKLFRWLACATTAWPRARLVGKADDDTFIHLPGVSSPCTNVPRSHAHAAHTTHVYVR